MLYFSYVHMLEAVSVRRHTTRCSLVLCLLTLRQSEGSDREWYKVQSTFSLGHGSLLRQKPFSDKFILLKTIVCKKQRKLYCHLQSQEVSINTDP